MPDLRHITSMLLTAALMAALQATTAAQCDIAIPDLGCDNVTYQNECTVCGDGSPVIIALYIDFPDQPPGEDYGITLEYGNPADGFQTWSNPDYNSGGTIQFVIDTTTFIYLTEVICPNGDSDFDGLGDTVTYFYELEPIFDSPGTLTGCDSVELPVITGTNVPPDAAYYSAPGGTGTQYLPGEYISASQFLWIYGTTANCTGEAAFEVVVSEVITSVLSVECNDNGTASDPSDDFYEATVLVEGVNTGPGWTADDPASTSGLFGETIVLSPLDTNEIYDITFTDDSADGCFSSVTIQTDDSCSDEDCNITIIAGDVLCQSQFTWFDPSDDVISQGLFISNGGAGGTFTANDPLNTTGSFETITVFGPYSSMGEDVTFTITSDDDPSCFIEWTVEHTCNTDCEIQSVIIDSIECNDGDTPNDDTDDFITFVVNVNGGIDLSEGYFITSSEGSVLPPFGYYDSLLSFQTLWGTAGDPPTITITVIDFDNPECTFDVEIDNPGVCSDPLVCELTDAGLGDITCNDFGTPGIPDDDYLDITLDPTGTGLGSTYTVTSTSVIVSPGSASYGSPTAFQLLNAYLAPNPIILVISDDDDPDCSLIVEVENLTPCTVDCSIETTLLSLNDCDDNGTPNDPSDDTYTYEVTVSGIGFGTGWTANDPESSSGEYDVQQTIGPYLISAGSIEVIITDTDDPTCADTITLVPPPPCSDPPPCTIDTAIISSVICNNNGTPGDPGDDFIEFTINVSGAQTSGNYTISSSSGTINPGTGEYDQAITFATEPGTAGAGNMTINLADADDTGCTYSFTLEDPGACSNACVIDVVLSGTICDDNGTPSNPDDDLFTAEVLVTGSGTGWTADDPGSSSGSMGVPDTIGPFPISGGSVTITLTDNNDPSCSTQLVIDDIPQACSDACEIQVELTDLVCDDNGTSNTSADDVYIATVFVTGSNTGTEWSIDDPVFASGAYSELVDIGPLSLSGTTIIEFFDQTDPTCVTNLVIDGAGGCSSGCPAADTTFLNAETCNPAEAGMSTDVLISSAGCDSIVITETILVNSSPTFLSTFSCDPSDTGTFSQTLQNSAGCDSLVITEVLLAESDTIVFLSNTCDPADTSTTIQELINAQGCDSIIITLVQLSPTDTTVLSTTSCNPADTSSSVEILSNASGCDSVVITEVLFSLADTTFIFSTTCDPDDTTSTSTLLTNSQGCDSLVISQNIFIGGDTTILLTNTCDPTDTSTTIDILTNVSGCDSVIITLVDLLSSDTTFLSGVSCIPQDTGMTITTLQSGNGCDSVIVETISYALSDTTLFFDQSCNPQDTGVSITNLTAANGCDSVVVISTSLLVSDSTFIIENVCNPADSGAVVTNFVNQLGCDSVVVTQSILVQADTVMINETICPDDSILIFSEYYSINNPSGVVIVPVLQGCDSVIIVSVDFHPQPIRQSIDTVLCEGDFLVINGEVFNESNPFGIQVLPSASNSCDSVIVEVNLAFETIVPRTTLRQPSCAGATGSVVINDIDGALLPVLLDFNGDTTLLIESLPYEYSGIPAGGYVLSFLDNSGCFAADSITMADGAVANISIDSIIAIAPGEEVQLRPQINFAYDSISWVPGEALSCSNCPEPFVTTNIDTDLMVTAFSTNGCSAQAQLSLKFERESNIYAPNVFSPNGDGVNDFFTVYSNDPGSIIMDLRVFDRWGGLLFQKSQFAPNVPSEGWDGRSQGATVNPGVFVYYAELITSDARTERISGDVTVIK